MKRTKKAAGKTHHPDDKSSLKSHASVLLTEADQAEEALRESEERYLRIVSAVTDYIFTVDVENGRAVRTLHGPACVAVTGYTAEEFAADPYLWFRMVFDEDREDVRRHAERILSGDDPGAIEHRLWHKNGTVRWVRNTPVLHRNVSGALISYDGLISDITARRKAEEALKDSEERFRQVAENANEWIWEVDPEGLYTYASSVVERILGYKPEEIVGKKHFYDFFAPDVKKELKKAAFEVFSRKEAFRGFVNPNINKNGGIVILETSGAPILDRKGVLLGYRGVDMDITERKKADAELKKAKDEIELWNAELEKRIKEKTKELEKSQAMLFQAEKLSAMGRLAGGLAHELNTPLAGLLPMLEKYREKAAGDAEAYREIDLMFKACKHMAEIVKDFSAFSRKSQDETHMINLNEIIEATLSFSIKQLLKMGIRVSTHYTEELPDVAGKTTELQQVILNMITNARDAMPDGGRLTIKTGYAEDKNNVIMEFIDSGTGIDQENLTKIFDPFFTTKKTGHGVGLGLSVSYGIIKNHNGDITVESEPGKGSRFIISLPVHQKKG